VQHLTIIVDKKLWKGAAMQGYKQLSYDEREKISQWLLEKVSKRQIANRLGRNPSSISREVNRNTTGEYVADVAETKTKKRRRRGCLLDRDGALGDFVKEKLTHCYWSPEQIAGHLKIAQGELRYVSHETIYQWIYGNMRKRKNCFNFLKDINPNAAKEKPEAMLHHAFPIVFLSIKGQTFKGYLATGKRTL
jgi:IS30 family transposase